MTESTSPRPVPPPLPAHERPLPSLGHAAAGDGPQPSAFDLLSGAESQEPSPAAWSMSASDRLLPETAAPRSGDRWGKLAIGAVAAVVAGVVAVELMRLTPVSPAKSPEPQAAAQPKTLASVESEPARSAAVPVSPKVEVAPGPAVPPKPIPTADGQAKQEGVAAASPPAPADGASHQAPAAKEPSPPPQVPAIAAATAPPPAAQHEPTAAAQPAAPAARAVAPSAPTGKTKAPIQTGSLPDAAAKPKAPVVLNPQKPASAPTAGSSGGSGGKSGASPAAPAKTASVSRPVNDAYTGPSPSTLLPRERAPPYEPPPAYDPPPRRLPPAPSVDSRNPYQVRAAQVGLHPQTSPELLRRLSNSDYRNADIAIQTALNETQDGRTFVWPRENWPDQATYFVKVSRGGAPGCRRYVVNIEKDGRMVTTPEMETCSSR